MNVNPQAPLNPVRPSFDPIQFEAKDKQVLLDKKDSSKGTHHTYRHVVKAESKSYKPAVQDFRGAAHQFASQTAAKVYETLLTPYTKIAQDSLKTFKVLNLTSNFTKLNDKSDRNSEALRLLAQLNIKELPPEEVRTFIEFISTQLDDQKLYETVQAKHPTIKNSADYALLILSWMNHRAYQGNNALSLTQYIINHRLNFPGFDEAKLEKILQTTVQELFNQRVDRFSANIDHYLSSQEKLSQLLTSNIAKVTDFLTDRLALAFENADPKKFQGIFDHLIGTLNSQLKAHLEVEKAVKEYDKLYEIAKEKIKQPQPEDPQYQKWKSFYDLVDNKGGIEEFKNALRQDAALAAVRQNNQNYSVHEPYSEITQNLLDVLFPRSAGLADITQILFDQLAIPDELQKIIDEGKAIASYRLSQEKYKECAETIESTKKHFLSTELRATITDFIEVNISNQLKSFVQSFSKPAELEILLHDTILPTLNTTLASMWIEQTLYDSKKTTLPLFINYLNAPDNQKQTHFDQLAQVLKDRVSSNVELSHLKQLSNADVAKAIEGIESYLKNIQTIQNDQKQPFTTEKVEAAFNFYFNQPPVEADISPQLGDFVQTIVAVGQFPSWAQWALKRSFIKNKVAEKLSQALNNFRSTPYAFFNIAVGVIDNKLNAQPAPETTPSTFTLLKRLEQTLQTNNPQTFVRYSLLVNKETELAGLEQANQENEAVAQVRLERDALAKDFFNTAEGTAFKQFLDLAAKDQQTLIKALSDADIHPPQAESTQAWLRRVLENDNERKSVLAKLAARLTTLKTESFAKTAFTVYDQTLYRAKKIPFGKFIVKKLFGHQAQNVKKAFENVASFFSVAKRNELIISSEANHIAQALQDVPPVSPPIVVSFEPSFNKPKVNYKRGSNWIKVARVVGIVATLGLSEAIIALVKWKTRSQFYANKHETHLMDQVSRPLDEKGVELRKRASRVSLQVVEGQLDHPLQNRNAAEAPQRIKPEFDHSIQTAHRVFKRVVTEAAQILSQNNQDKIFKFQEKLRTLPIGIKNFLAQHLPADMRNKEALIQAIAACNNPQEFFNTARLITTNLNDSFKIDENEDLNTAKQKLVSKLQELLNVDKVLMDSLSEIEKQVQVVTNNLPAIVDEAVKKNAEVLFDGLFERLAQSLAEMDDTKWRETFDGLGQLLNQQLEAIEDKSNQTLALKLQQGGADRQTNIAHEKLLVVQELQAASERLNSNVEDVGQQGEVARLKQEVDNHFIKLAEGICSIIYRKEGSEQVYLDIWKKLVLPEDLQKLVDQIKVLLRSRLKAIDTFLKFPLFRQFAIHTLKNQVHKRLAQVLQNSFESLSKPQMWKDITANAILPAIRSLIFDKHCLMVLNENPKLVHDLFEMHLSNEAMDYNTEGTMILTEFEKKGGVKAALEPFKDLSEDDKQALKKKLFLDQVSFNQSHTRTILTSIVCSNAENYVVQNKAVNETKLTIITDQIQVLFADRSLASHQERLESAHTEDLINLFYADFVTSMKLPDKFKKVNEVIGEKYYLGREKYRQLIMPFIESLLNSVQAEVVSSAKTNKPVNFKAAIKEIFLPTLAHDKEKSSIYLGLVTKALRAGEINLGSTAEYLLSKFDYITPAFTPMRSSLRWFLSLISKQLDGYLTESKLQELLKPREEPIDEAAKKEAEEKAKAEAQAALIKVDADFKNENIYFANELVDFLDLIRNKNWKTRSVFKIADKVVGKVTTETLTNTVNSVQTKVLNERVFLQNFLLHAFENVVHAIKSE